MPIRLKFSKHAQDRIQERVLQAEHIKIAIREPDLARITFDNRIKVSKKLPNDRTITVIYYKEDFRGTNDYFIITAYYI
jgi:hypothetical protein